MVGECGCHDGEDLPEDEHEPQEQREQLWPACRDHQRCGDTHAESAADSADGEGESYEKSRDQLQLAARGAQRIHEEAPAQCSNRGQLRTCADGEVEFTHGS
jgi:hypothetical protein